MSPHSKTVGLSPTAATLRTEQAYPRDRRTGPVRRGRGRSSESRGAPGPHSLGGTWGGTTTPMRLDAGAPRSLLAIAYANLSDMHVATRLPEWRPPDAEHTHAAISASSPIGPAAPVQADRPPSLVAEPRRSRAGPAAPGVAPRRRTGAAEAATNRDLPTPCRPPRAVTADSAGPHVGRYCRRRRTATGDRSAAYRGGVPLRRRSAGTGPSARVAPTAAP